MKGFSDIMVMRSVPFRNGRQRERERRFKEEEACGETMGNLDLSSLEQISKCQRKIRREKEKVRVRNLKFAFDFPNEI